MSTLRLKMKRVYLKIASSARERPRGNMSDFFFLNVAEVLVSKEDSDRAQKSTAEALGYQLSVKL